MKLTPAEVASIFLLLMGLSLPLPAAHSCPASNKASAKPDQHQVFTGDVSVEKEIRSGKRYIHFTLRTSLPESTRILVKLYYIRGEKAYEKLADKRILRVSGTGLISGDLLGYKRDIWSGCYRLVVKFNPTNQVPYVLRQLEKVDDPVRLEKNWYHGTPERLRQQKKQAVESATRDFQHLLRLADQLKQQVNHYQQYSRPDIYVTPMFIRDRFTGQWLIIRSLLKEQLKRLTSSNERRPRYNGDPVGYFHIEERTAYFLQNYIQDLKSLFTLVDQWKLLDSKKAEFVQSFLKKYRNFYDRVTDTMVMINLDVPFSREQRRSLRRILNRTRELFRKLGNAMDQLSTGTKHNQEREKVKSLLLNIQSTLYRTDSEITDEIYQKMLTLTKKAQKVHARVDDMPVKQMQKDVKKLRKQFEETRSIAIDMMNKPGPNSKTRNEETE